MNLPMKQKQTHRHKKQTCGCQEGRGKEAMDWGDLGQQMQTVTYGMDKQQGPTTQHRELHLISCDKP